PAFVGFSRPYTNEVPGTGATGQTGKGIKRRFVLIKERVFWEDAHAQFIERRAAQGCQCLLLKLVALMHPGIAGGTDLFVGRSIGIDEVGGLGDPHRPMITWCGSDTGKRSLGTVESVEVASCAILPGSLDVWHKANAVDAITIVEAIHLDQTMLASKLSSKCHIQ